MIKEIDSKVQALVGRKVNMKVTDHEHAIGLDIFKYQQYEIIDSDFINEVNEIASDYRLSPPDTIGTLDYVEARLNVHINQEGIVTEVSYG